MSQVAVGCGLLCYAMFLAGVIRLRFKHGVSIGGPFTTVLVSRKDEPAPFWLEIVPAIAVDLFATAIGLFLLVEPNFR